MQKYTTISLPAELHRKINKFIKENPGLGYGSVAEFAKEAIRMRVSDLKEEIKVIVSEKLRNAKIRSWEEIWEEFRNSCRK
ncbi:hypothetical protein B6U81_04515 [Thermoplasmatales archaeon ex4484_30]|nr:MAG: hypothetical protein B6U81_04515 [Thermoplasmatales archaeon ex4484_30]